MKTKGPGQLLQLPYQRDSSSHLESPWDEKEKLSNFHIAVLNLAENGTSCSFKLGYQCSLMNED